MGILPIWWWLDFLSPYLPNNFTYCCHSLISANAAWYSFWKATISSRLSHLSEPTEWSVDFWSPLACWAPSFTSFADSIGIRTYFSAQLTALNKSANPFWFQPACPTCFLFHFALKPVAYCNSTCMVGLFRATIWVIASSLSQRGLSLWFLGNLKKWKCKWKSIQYFCRSVTTNGQSYRLSSLSSSINTTRTLYLPLNLCIWYIRLL